MVQVGTGLGILCGAEALWRVQDWAGARQGGRLLAVPDWLRALEAGSWLQGREAGSRQQLEGSYRRQSMTRQVVGQR